MTTSNNEHARNKRSHHMYQIRALLRKQFTLQLRQKKTIVCQIIFPIVMLLFIFLYTLIMNNVMKNIGGKTPPTPMYHTHVQVDDILPKVLAMHPALEPNETMMFPHRFLFTSTPELHSSVGYLGAYGNSSGLLSHVTQHETTDLYHVHNFPYGVWRNSTKEMDDEIYLDKMHLGSLQGYFGSAQIEKLETDGESKGISYVVQAPNDCSLFRQKSKTGRKLFPSDFCQYGFRALMTNMMNNAYVKAVLGNLTVTIETSFERFPEMYSLNLSGMMMDSSSQVVHLVLLFPLPMFIFTLLLEKTTKIREMMKLNGMKMKYYWMTYYVLHACIYLFFTCALVYVCGLAFQFPWAYANPITIFIFLLACCCNILGFAVFMASILNNVLLGIVLGYLVALFLPSVTMMIELIVISKTGNQFLFLLLIPPFATEHVLTSGLVRPCQNYECPTFKTLISWNSYTRGVLFMFINGVLYSALGMYLDAVMPREWGIQKHPLFFLSPIKKLFSKRRKMEINERETQGLLHDLETMNDAESSTIDISDSLPFEDSDVFGEKRKVARIVNALNNGSDEQVPPIVINSMNKFYGSFQAVKDLSLVIDAGTCFGLLGPNGAGKTTTFNVLCGLSHPSSGTALINGFDIRTDMDMVHRSMGLAPQYEVVYDDLTVEEHLLFYSRLKGVPKNEEKLHVEHIMESVGLHEKEERAKTARQLSGGMRRRLSLAMALCGDPALILCDEPTTGLDPTSRRQVWSIIQKQKEQGRCIILTTHSLDEADVLCDRIGIVKTTLLCVGSSFHLKSKYGQSYRLIMNYNTQARPTGESEALIEEFIKKNICKSVKTSSQYVGNLIMELPTADISIDISRLFHLIEGYKAETGNLIEEYNFSQTTLEDVFMSITTDGEEALSFT